MDSAVRRVFPPILKRGTLFGGILSVSLLVEYGTIPYIDSKEVQTC